MAKDCVSSTSLNVSQHPSLSTASRLLCGQKYRSFARRPWGLNDRWGRIPAVRGVYFGGRGERMLKTDACCNSKTL